MKKTLLGLGTAILLGTTGIANATLFLTLDDGLGSVKTITDNEAGFDTIATDGIINWVGAWGGFDVSLSTGAGTEALDLPALLHLNVFVYNQVGDAALTITLSDDAALGDGTFSYNVGGGGAGSLTSSASVGATTIGPISGFSGADNVMGLNLIEPYTASISATFEMSGNGAASADMWLNVPEPSVIALFGLGLVGLGFAGRRRQSK